jgi:hypothetical protein
MSTALFPCTKEGYLYFHSYFCSDLQGMDNCPYLVQYSKPSIKKASRARNRTYVISYNDFKTFERRNRKLFKYMKGLRRKQNTIGIPALHQRIM